MKRRQFIEGTLAGAMAVSQTGAQARTTDPTTDATLACVTIEGPQTGKPHAGKVLATIAPHSDDHSIAAGGTIAKLIEEGYTGYLIRTSNDEMAAGVYRVANRLGLSIPGDLSIVGFDDGPLAARLLPSLTTIRLPIRELGRIAANKLLHPEAAASHAVVTPLEPHLVIRDSCQPPAR